MKNILACTLSLLLPAASLRAAGINTANSDPFNPDAVRVNEPGREYWLRPMFLQLQTLLRAARPGCC